MLTNLDLAVDVLAHIELEPERWNQDVWARANKPSDNTAACGTAFCFAGWALALAGEELDWLPVDGNTELGAYRALRTLRGGHISSEACRVLGMDGAATSAIRFGDLFFAENALDDLYTGTAAKAGIPVKVLRARVTLRVHGLATVLLATAKEEATKAQDLANLAHRKYEHLVEAAAL